jgi:hypothetical protein
MESDEQGKRAVRARSSQPRDKSVETGSSIMEEAYMTEIRLKRIVDRPNQEQGNQLSDGDEIMIKDGVGISEFSKEAIGLGKEVYADEGNAPTILKKVYVLYEKYVGPDSVFPVSNGASRIMTQFEDRPYSYELQPYLGPRICSQCALEVH